MRKLTLFSVAVFLFMGAYHSTSAQNYDRAIGLRLGYPTSVTFKNFIDESSAIEVYAGTRGWASYRWYNIAGAYQWHNDIGEVENLQYYFGAGASVFFWTFEFSSSFSSTTVGLQGYAGLDYRFDDVPINLSVDWIPTIYLGDAFSTGFAGGFGTFTARYIIGD